jgi:hypothetical protein
MKKMASETEEVSCNLVILSNDNLDKDVAGDDNKIEEDMFFGMPKTSRT